MGFGSKSLLWLDVEATSENVTVACGEDVPADAPRGCPTTTVSVFKTSETTSVTTTASSQISPLSMIGNETLTTSQLTFLHLNEISKCLSTDTGQETSFHSTEVSTATDSSVVTIVGSGGMTVLLLIGLAFLCYHKRRSNTQRDSLKEESKTESQPRPIIHSDRAPVTDENHIYENEDFQLKVRQIAVTDDDKVNRDHADYENVHFYSTIDGD